jgi:hypothetical protein
MPTPELGEEHRSALRRAARLAGNPALVPELERLVATYKRDRAELSDAPTVGQRNHRLREFADHFEQLRQWAATDPWVARALEEIEEPPLPIWNGMDLDFLLANQARRFRVAASHYAPGDRRSADREPGGPLWRLLWTLAGVWAGCGHRVGIGAESQFFAFAAGVVSATGDTLTERPANEVARRWREREASMTEESVKKALPSFYS